MVEIFKNFCVVIVLFQLSIIGVIGISFLIEYWQEQKQLNRRNDYFDSL